MSESKFTPGPLTTDGCEIITEDYTTHIATAWADNSVGRCVSRNEAIANAVLFAAAPEMLACLEELLEWICSGYDASIYDIEEAARVVQKAKGEA